MNISKILKMSGIALDVIQSSGLGDSSERLSRLLTILINVMQYFRRYSDIREIREMENWVREKMPDKVDLFCDDS
jgi:hypothetical protein